MHLWHLEVVDAEVIGIEHGGVSVPQVADKFVECLDIEGVSNSFLSFAQVLDYGQVSRHIVTIEWGFAVHLVPNEVLADAVVLRPCGFDLDDFENLLFALVGINRDDILHAVCATYDFFVATHE